MGLTGTLKDGTRIDAIPYCQFECEQPNSQGEIGDCGNEPRYRVTFTTGEVLAACEEHAQRLWDGEVETGERGK